MALDGRDPVLVGVGVADQRVEDPADGVGAFELMATAVRAAADDAGAPALLGSIGQISVPQGSWKCRDPARLVARQIGASGARTILAELGVSQQSTINHTLRGIRDGALDVAVVVGGESRRLDMLAARAGVTLPPVEDPGADPDLTRTRSPDIVAQAEIDANVFPAVLQYALIEQALRRAEGVSLDAHRDEIARLWASFNRVGVANPHATFPMPRDAAFLREPSDENRPLAFPYNKWHATQWTVDQAGALLLCSVDAARAAGVDPERWVLPLVGLESSMPFSLSQRRDLHRWPAMGVLGRAASEHLGRPLAALAHQELYSCFPAAVRVQQRELGLALDGVPTVTGGMAFAGGPFNNFVLQATATMAQHLREHRGEPGLVTTVSGLLTTPGLAVWCADEGDEPALVEDLADRAVEETATVESVAGYSGPATVATFTVTYDGQDPVRTIVIGDTPDGRRCVAASDDAALAERATHEDLIGTSIRADGARFTV